MKQFLAVLLASCTLGSIAWTQTVFGIDSQGNTYSINGITGTGTFKNSTGLSDVRAMARRLDSSVWVASNSGGASSIDELQYINGTTTHITTVPLGGIRALAITFTGGLKLYAVNDSLGSGGPDDLYSIDTSLGTATLIGPIGFSGVEGLTYAGST